MKTIAENCGPHDTSKEMEKPGTEYVELRGHDAMLKSFDFLLKREGLELVVIDIGASDGIGLRIVKRRGRR